jgi:hexosaminidase
MATTNPMDMLKNTLRIACFLFVCIGSLTAQDLSIIPYPKEVRKSNGRFRFQSGTRIFYDVAADAYRVGMEPLHEKLRKAAGLTLRETRTSPDQNGIIVRKMTTPAASGAYKLNVSEQRIDIEVQDPVGLFYATQTLLQLLPPAVESPVKVAGVQWEIPAVNINDEPAFPYRGLMLDVGRHFQPISFLKKLIDLMAMQKMNNLHLHLTEDQGWRMEIKKYPNLTRIGAYRNGTIIGKYPGSGSDETPYGGFYTQEELKDLVAYAGRRFINIVPEIELPGHASALIAAYPQLSCFPEERTTPLPTMMAKKSLEALKTPGTKLVQETWGVFQDVLCPTEYTFRFLQDVMDEVMAVFPSPYIHIGGDECPKDYWKRSAFCQQMIREKGLKDEHGLQSYFIQTIEKYLNAKGRRIVGWDEILEGGLAPNATVMSWRGVSGGIESAKQRHDVIMTPDSHCYLNFYQSDDPQDSIAWGGYLPLNRVYGYDPIPRELTAEEAVYIKGVQGNLWTEYVKSSPLAEYMLFPRALALAEIGWRKEKTGFESFVRRVIGYLPRLGHHQVNYSQHLFEIAVKGTPQPGSRNIEVAISGVPKDQSVFYRINNGERKPYTSSLVLNTSAVVEAMVEKEGKVLDKNSATFLINKATGSRFRLSAQADAPYNKGGENVLVNGILANPARFSDPEWLGFNGKDAEATLDLGRVEKLNQLTSRFYHAPGSWIYAPGSMTVQVSRDGQDFSQEKTIEVNPSKEGSVLVRLSLGDVEARYVRIIVKNHGTIKAGQPGAGNPAWMFMDELTLE